MSGWFYRLKNFYRGNQNTFNILFLVFLPCLVFYNSLNCYFLAYDDYNGLLHIKRSFTDIFTSNVHGTRSGGSYRPFEVLSHIFDISFYGDESVFGRRLTNLVFHILNTVLIYFLGIHLFGKKMVGLLQDSGNNLFFLYREKHFKLINVRKII